MMTRHYKVAGHTFAVSGQAEFFEQMGNYEPFRCEDGEPLFSLIAESGEAPEYTEVYRRLEDGFIYGHDASGNVVIVNDWRRDTVIYQIISKDYRKCRLIMTGGYSKLMFDYALQSMYSLATARKDTLVLHAVVVSCGGRGYIFLGPCGTGKSTHGRLWLEHVEGVELVNDDHPVVRDRVVYGSPWSPMKPCYKNVNYPIGSFVRLSQAPCNKIRCLSGIEAYMNLVCCDWGRLLDAPVTKGIAESLHQTEERLVSTIPMWHLDCLPDEEAARLCHDTVCELTGTMS